MADVYVNLPFDPTGTNTTNLISGEIHSLDPVTNFPYKIITMDNGGFYARSVRVYDANYKRLNIDTDYIITYRYPEISLDTGLQVGGAIVFLDKTRTGTVYVSAQMVGSDVAFSLTVISEYVEWFNKQPADYIPRNMDFDGVAPIWLPGELNQERWRLDTFQPFNNEIYYLSRGAEGGRGNYEQNFRDNVKQEYTRFLEIFNDRLQRHIEDLDNPHVDTRVSVGLSLLENFAVATTEESIAGESVTTYQTPALSWETLNEFAVKPLNKHLTDEDNPHETNPAKIDSPVKTFVDSVISNKYFDDETVENTNLFTNGVNDYEYAGYSSLVRRDIPASNFVAGGTNGYVLPQRIGRGSPSVNHVLRSEGNWATWASLLSEFAPAASADLLVMQLAGNTPATAHQIAISQPWAMTAPIGSIILYRLNTSYAWGAGNGISTGTYSIVYGSVKSPSGWIQI